jgi:hypothetical protein
MGAFWGIKSALGGGGDEYRGWRKFRRATGLWPIWSILASATSIPVLFGAGVYVFIRAMETHRLLLIYTALIIVGFGLGLLWYAIRRLANHADVLRGQRNSTRSVSPSVDRFIR